MSSSILLTGAAGFIGSAFVRQRLASDSLCRIVNLDIMSYAATRTSISCDDSQRYQLVEGSITDRELVAELLEREQPDAIVNFAAESHVDRSIDGPEAFVMTNVVGTFRLLDETLRWWRGLDADRKEMFRFLHVSTDEVYGSLGETGLFTEQTPYAPNSPYSASKASSDHFVRAYHHTYKLPVLTTNCSNNYGPYQFPEKLIPLVTLNAIAGRELPVYGTGSNIRDWLFVEDHCTAISTVLKLGCVGEVYNVGGGAERTNLQVVEAICDIVDELCGPLAGGSRRGLIRFVADRPGHDQRYAIDCSKLTTELGWRPSVTFELGIRKTIQWYLENSQWIEEARSGNYAGQRLGLSV